MAADPEALGIDTTNLSESQIAEQKRAVALAKAATLARTSRLTLTGEETRRAVKRFVPFLQRQCPGTANFARGSPCQADCFSLWHLSVVF